MADDSEPSKAQLRWRRNKRDQRARAKPKPIELSSEFLKSIEAERAKRASYAARKWASDHPDLNYFTSKGGAHWVALRWSELRWNEWRGGHWHAFAADVWAATVEIEASLGSGKATPTMIARHLDAKNRLHGYTVNSARVMVPRARFTIAALEQAALNDPEAEFWLPVKLADWGCCRQS